MALGSGFRGRTRCPVWLLGHSEATIIPLGRGNQTNPIYSGKPGEASHRIIPNCRCEIVARGFVLGQMSGLTFLSAEVHWLDHWLDPLAGPHSWSMGWINIWQGTSGQSVLDIRGTLFCQVSLVSGSFLNVSCLTSWRDRQEYGRECLCGSCLTSWRHRGWTCPLKLRPLELAERFDRWSLLNASELAERFGLLNASTAGACLLNASARTQ